MNIIKGNWMSHAVCVVVQLGIADLLAKRPCTAGELSSATECHGPTLARFGETGVGCAQDVADGAEIRLFKLRNGAHNLPVASEAIIKRL